MVEEENEEEEAITKEYTACLVMKWIGLFVSLCFLDFVLVHKNKEEVEEDEGGMRMRS